MKRIQVNLLKFEVLIGILSCLILFSCSDKDMPVYSKLDSLRVLALVADKPEAAPGTSIQVTPYISDALGSGRALTYTAKVCLDPGVAYGSTPSCESSTSVQTLAQNQSVNSLASSVSYSGAVNTISFTLPVSTVIFAGQSSQAQYNGVNYLLTYTLKASDGTQVSSFKRIVVSTRTLLNSNPTITDIQKSGASFTSWISGSSNLAPTISAGSAESYTYYDSQNLLSTARESLLVSWFTNAGEFESIRTLSTATNLLTPSSSAPSSGHQTLIVVGRDMRGGETVFQRDF